ncbi:thiamine-phosphate pyrophosphorylase [Clostridium acetobutylicum]|uniref:Thiamine-phosphate synthase n=1 Tax=Clostridium acetobutylicum (strain ATCC 824 / DSM 792 / JCM 1419 / IAM 19013 / LMG 5710 / NBRC 13948 / NRRL B-527 / VKM B-1787 / 2291 / W) TaxID=272562 RepID=THIE_CLOAB|nr:MULTISPECIES: thiamine phosphate synthase [Clostridium]Q97LQ9.1 RecName: Full=Thiamine-phosphate synthase; Short=TP synthase; Short=TPS; AltName: Full=Thiamine-phosphate pyrophosphorylase; Short=TMP pyrophosphorylase; Short=TMP-PPase [Clostridium acetobutylicum ATCC 824]AAK78475.1 Thiamine monophosphate syntase [Clostridium acetobutylicum ATCC 824]ADZ19545.1 Thiamine monophosphate syntase [Clostridium acetobutylicum EA 2018]AEI34332.1 thiamine monophosphate syntase [Clostridium acetobutylicu
MKNVDYKLYLVTDRKVLKERDLYKSIEEAIKGGVTLVQLREKEMSTLDFYESALKLKKITETYKIPLIINDRIDIALAINADGVHIGQSDMPLIKARELLGKDKIIGVSAHSIEEALEAERNGATYLGVGAIYNTSTKGDAQAVSLEELKNIKNSVKIPVVGIGGINEENANKVIETGVDGISVISGILSAQKIKDKARVMFDIVKKNSTK